MCFRLFLVFIGKRIEEADPRQIGVKEHPEKKSGRECER